VVAGAGTAPARRAAATSPYSCDHNKTQGEAALEKLRKIFPICYEMRAIRIRIIKIGREKSYKITQKNESGM
jgi:hypothetical protein